MRNPFTTVTIKYKMLDSRDDYCTYLKATITKTLFKKAKVREERRFGVREVTYWRDTISGDYLPF
jgi:hypothetical protein